MSYRVVHDYYRREHFEFFRRYRHPFWAVNFELDAARLKAFLDERGYPTYLNLCYLVTRAMQPLEDFRYRLVDGEIALFDRLDPGLVVAAPDRRFGFAYFDYDPSIEAFNLAAAPGYERAASGASLVERGGRAWVYFSSLPKVPFTGLTHAVDDPADAEPRVTFGRFRRDGDRLLVPVGLQVNHLFVDGAPVGELVEGAQAAFDDPEAG